MKVYIHECDDDTACLLEWSERWSKEPHEVRHQCAQDHEHDGDHVCMCRLVEAAA